MTDAEEKRVERMARAIAQVIARKYARESADFKRMPAMQREAAITTMANGMWKDLLLEADAAAIAYAEPVEA